MRSAESCAVSDSERLGGRVRTRQLLAALPYLVRIGRWSVPGGAALLGAALLVAASQLAGWGPGPALASLRLAAVALCAAAVLTLDDPAADTTAASPLPLRHRRGAGIVLAMAAVTVAWVALLGLASRLLGACTDDVCLVRVHVPVTLELVWLLAVGVAVATLAARRLGAPAGGLAAGPAVVLLHVAAHQLPDGWARVPLGTDPATWGPAHWRLVALAGAGGVLTLWAIRDPWTRIVGRLPDRRGAVPPASTTALAESVPSGDDGAFGADDGEDGQ